MATEKTVYLPTSMTKKSGSGGASALGISQTSILPTSLSGSGQNAIKSSTKTDYLPTSLARVQKASSPLQSAETVQKESENNGGVLGGAGYVAEKTALGFLSGIEGIWDYSAGGLAKLFGADAFAERQFQNDWVNYNHADEWYDPSEGWQVAGDVFGGIGTSLPAIAGVAIGSAIAVGSGGTLSPVAAGLISASIAGLGAAGNATKEAYRESGELDGKAFGYGALSGATEAGVEFITAGLAKGTGRIVSSLASRTAKETTETLAKTSMKTVLKGIGEDFFMEGVEEGLSEALAPVYKRLTYDSSAKNATLGEIGYAAIIGGLSGLLMSGTGSAISTTENIFAGKRAVERGATASILENARQISAAEEKYDTGYDAFKTVRETYAALSESLKKTGGAVSTLRQEMLLGHLQKANTAAIFTPIVEKSAMNILANAETTAERFTALGMTGSDGKALTFTTEDILSGIDASLLTKATLTKAEKKTLVKQIRGALSGDTALARLAIMDATGHIMMDTRKIAEAMKNGSNLVDTDTLNYFSENASAREIEEVSGLFDIADWNTVTLDDIKARAGAFTATEAGAEYFGKEELMKTAKALPEEKTLPLPHAVGPLMQDGAYRYKSEKGDVEAALLKNGETYHLYNYETELLSREMSMKEVNGVFSQYYTNKKAAFTENAGGERYAISESFQKQLTKWDRTTIGFSFVLGNTSKALKAAGIPDKQIRWDASKIKTILSQHSGMTMETISQIPELLENPIVVIDSKQNENARIVMGNLHDGNGKLVTAVLLLTPTSKKGNQLDILKIASAQGRGHIESLFRYEDGTSVKIRYTDKNRIQEWLNANRLQLPLHSFNLDPHKTDAQPTNAEALIATPETKSSMNTVSIDSISQNGENVNSADTKTGNKPSAKRIAVVGSQPPWSLPKNSISQNGENVNSNAAKKLDIREMAADGRANQLCMEKVSSYKGLSEPSKRMVRMTLRQALAHGFSEEDALSFARVAARSGLNIVFSTVRTAAADGIFDNGTIYIDPKAPKERLHSTLLLHEVGHALLREKDGRNLIAEAFKHIDPARSQEITERYRDFYAEKGFSFYEARPIIDEEITVAYIEDTLHDIDAWDYILSEKPSVKKGLIPFLYKSIQAYIEDRKLPAEARRLINTYKKLFDELSARNMGNNAASMAERDMRAPAMGGERYAIKETTNGDKFTVIGKSSVDELMAQEGETLPAKVRSFLKKYRKTILPIGSSDKAYFRRESENEYTNPAKHLDERTYDSKLKAASEISNILKCSKYLRHEADNGRHPDAVRGWNYYETVFAIPTDMGMKVYQGEISIKLIERGDCFYDMTKIKDITDGTAGQAYLKAAGSVNDVSAYSISQDAKNVKRDNGKRFALPEDSKAAKQAVIQFQADIDRWQRNGMPTGEHFILGMTSETLQGLGAIESDIYMNGDKIKTILTEHEEITLDEIKKIPQILENPILILKSRNIGRGNKQNTRMVLFGSVKAKNGLPVLSVLDLKPKENGFILDDLQKIDSAYTKTTNAVSFIQNSDILYASDKKTTPLLRTIGFYMPIELNESGFIGSIAYEGQNVNLFGKKFSEVVSLRDDGKRFALPREAKEEIAKAKKEAKEKIYESGRWQKFAGHAANHAEKMKEIQIGVWRNATQPKVDTFNGLLGKFSKVSFRGNFNATGTRKIVKEFYEWYMDADVREQFLNPVGSVNGGFLNEDIEAKLKMLSDHDGAFSATELSMLCDIMGYMRKFTESWQKVLKGDKWVDADEEGRRYVTQYRRNAAYKTPALTSFIGSKYSRFFSDPMTLCRYYDSYEDGFFTTVVSMLRDGEIRAEAAEIRIRKPFDDFFKEHKGYLERVRRETVEYHGVRIPKKILMSLYMTVRRKQAQAGFALSGFVFEDTDGKKVRVGGMLSAANGYVSDDDIANYCKKAEFELKKLLSADDITYCKLVSGAMNGEIRALKVERDMERMGYSNASEGFYYPIQRADTFKKLDTEFGEIDRISNASFNKDTVTYAKGKLYISPIDEVFERHLHGVAQYRYLTGPIEYYDRMFSHDISGNAADTVSVKTVTENLWAESDKYIRKLVQDMQGIPASSTEGAAVMSFLRSGYAKFRLGANPKVWAVQLSSFFAASAKLDADSILRGIALSSKDVNEYCELAMVRSYENEAARAQGILDSRAKRVKTKLGRFTDALMAHIGTMDGFVVGRLFGACQVQVAKDSGPEIGTHENKTAAGKLLTEVILETQQNATATDRSAAMRSGNEVYKTITMFSADNMKLTGRVLDAFGELTVLQAKLKNAKTEAERAAIREAQKRARRAFRKASAAMVSQAAVVAAISQLFLFLYAKEDEEKWKTFLLDAVGNLLGGLPFLRDIYSFIVDGYGLESYTYSTVNDLFTSTKAVMEAGASLFTGKGTVQDRNRAMRDMAYAAGELFGVPTQNIYNAITGITRRISFQTGYKIDSMFYKKNYQKDLYKAIEDGDDEMTLTIMEMLLGERLTGGTSEAVLNELISVSNSGERVLPRTIPDSITVDEVEFEITKDEQAKMKDIYSASSGALDALIARPSYGHFTAEQKADSINYIKELYYDMAVEETLGIDRKNRYLILTDCLGAENLAIFYAKTKGLESDRTRDGEIIAGSKKRKVVSAVRTLPLRVEERLLLIAMKGYSLTGLGMAGVSDETAETRLLRYIMTLSGKTQAEKAEIAEMCGFEVKNGKIL